MKRYPNIKHDGPYMETREYGASLRRDSSTLTEGWRGVSMGHRDLAEGRGPWAEGGAPFEESRTFRQGRLEPLEKRAPTYKEELEQQIREKQESRRLEKEEEDRAEAKLLADSRNYDPWGRGGCGAPLRDTRGNLITDLKQMHRQNEEAWLNPETSLKRDNATLPILRKERPLPPISRVSAFDPTTSPEYTTGSVFTEGKRGLHWGHRLAEGRGTWAEETGPLFRESRTSRLGRVEPVKRRAPTYQEELEQQIREKQESRRLEKEERDRAEAKLEAESRYYDPWGRGGCGAPLRDTRGNLLTDLKEMHRQNEEAWLNPETSLKRDNATMPILRKDRLLPPISTVSGFDCVQTSAYARGNVFANQPTPQQIVEQAKYMSHLKQQIEEKRLKAAEERDKLRLEEEKEEKRLVEQRALIQREYDEEQKAMKYREKEKKAKNMELIHLAKDRREKQEMMKEVEEKEIAAVRMQYFKEKQARINQVRRENSPPIPTLQKRDKAPQASPRPPSMDSKRPMAPMPEGSLLGLQSHTHSVPAVRKKLRAAVRLPDNNGRVLFQLSAIRTKLRSEQKRVEGQLMRSERLEPNSHE